jgi:hypothetical protein
MKKNVNENPGVTRLLNEYKKIFRIPENLNFYSEEDYQQAERKFLKYALYTGRIERRLEL